MKRGGGGDKKKSYCFQLFFGLKTTGIKTANVLVGWKYQF